MFSGKGPVCWITDHMYGKNRYILVDKPQDLFSGLQITVINIAPNTTPHHLRLLQFHCHPANRL